MSDSKTCPECQQPMTGELCHACLMKQSLESGTIFNGTSEKFAPAEPEEIAVHFPAYEIMSCLGRGGMGVVYKARQKSLNRLVAIKILAPEKKHDDDFARRFAHEAELLARLNHSGIVTIYDFGESGGLFYLVMEFIDGVNLRDILRDGKLDSTQALVIVPQICEALQFAHEAGVIHRDIKPENILLDRLGQVKIADFGVAALVDEPADRISGTPAYMAPESEVDHRADIYALGIVLYEMLTGERPDKDVIKPSEKVALDVKIDEVVLRALKQSPTLRYQTVEELSRDLQTLQVIPNQLSPERRPKTKFSVKVVGGFLLIGLFTVLGAIFLFSIISANSQKNQTQENDMNLKKMTQTITAVAAAGTIATAEPEKPQPISQKERAELKQEARERAREDRSEYTRYELAALEELYQVANKNWRSDRPKAKKAMKELVKKYKKANRTGCAMLYLGQLSRGKERDEYLEKAIKDFSDCYYFNGVQVGGWARFLRMKDLQQDRDERAAKKLEKQLRTKYKKAITHSGIRIVDILDFEKEQE